MGPNMKAYPRFPIRLPRHQGTKKSGTSRLPAMTMYAGLCRQPTPPRCLTAVLPWRCTCAPRRCCVGHGGGCGGALLAGHAGADAAHGRLPGVLRSCRGVGRVPTAGGPMVRRARAVGQLG